MSSQKKGWALTGDKKLDRKLRKMERKDIAKKIIKPALSGELKRLLPKVKNAIPVDTGNLRNQVQIKSMKASRKHRGQYIRTSKKATKKNPDQGKGAWYGAFHEYGTRQRTTEEDMYVSMLGFYSSNRGSIRPSRSITGVYKSNNKGMVRRVEEAIKNNILKVARGG
jgi:hypothetical protein